MENLLTLPFIKASGVLCAKFRFEDYDYISSRCREDALKSDPMLYFDMKEGLDTEKVRKLPNNPTKTWIQENFSLPDENEEFILKNIDGFGKNILSNVTSNGAAMKLLRSEIRSNRWFQTFGDPFVIATWYFAASASQRT